MTHHGDLYYEGKEFEIRLKSTKSWQWWNKNVGDPVDLTSLCPETPWQAIKLHFPENLNSFVKQQDLELDNLETEREK